MANGEGGSWCRQDMVLGNEFYELVARSPLLAFKILTLDKITELGGLPVVKVLLNNGTIIEGDFDGILVERDHLKLQIFKLDKINLEIEILDVREIFVIEQDSAQITEESIARSLALDLEIEKYYRDQNANKRGDSSGGGGPSTSKVFASEGGNN